CPHSGSSKTASDHLPRETSECSARGERGSRETVGSTPEDGKPSARNGVSGNGDTGKRRSAAYSGSCYRYRYHRTSEQRTGHSNRDWWRFDISRRWQRWTGVSRHAVQALSP